MVKCANIANKVRSKKGWPPSLFLFNILLEKAGEGRKL